MSNDGSFSVHRKRVLSHDTGRWILCAWDDCERQGYENHKVQINEAKPGFPPKIIKFVFCSDGHRQYFIDENPAVRGRGDTAGLHGRLRSGNRSSSRYL